MWLLAILAGLALLIAKSKGQTTTGQTTAIQPVNATTFIDYAGGKLPVGKSELLNVKPGQGSSLLFFGGLIHGAVESGPVLFRQDQQMPATSSPAAATAGSGVPSGGGGGGGLPGGGGGLRALK